MKHTVIFLFFFSRQGGGSSEGNGENARAKLQATGRKMFNLDPRKGIKHLMDYG